jgi:hypothetical protein
MYGYERCRPEGLGPPGRGLPRAGGGACHARRAVGSGSPHEPAEDEPRDPKKPKRNPEEPGTHLHAVAWVWRRLLRNRSFSLTATLGGRSQQRTRAWQQDRHNPAPTVRKSELLTPLGRTMTEHDASRDQPPCLPTALDAVHAPRSPWRPQGRWRDHGRASRSTGERVRKAI